LDEIRPMFGVGLRAPALRTQQALCLLTPRVLSTYPSPTTAAQRVVCVIAPRNSPALAQVPHGLADFVIGESLDELLPRAAQAEAVLFIPPASPVLLEELWRGRHLPACRWVHCFFAGVDSVQPFALQHLLPAGLPLTNGRGAFSSSLAEYAFTAALHFNKQVARWLTNREGRVWDKFVMGELRGKTLGLLGMGDIAQACAALGKAFGMHVICLRRNASKQASVPNVDMVLGPYTGPIQPAHKRALLEQSDVVISTLPGTAETHHFMSFAEFDAMRADATFISIGRGSAVNEAALSRALLTGRLGGAALDVFEVEPLPPDSPLWSCGERLLLTAHNADYTDNYFKLGWSVWAVNFDRHVHGGPLATPVDIIAGY